MNTEERANRRTAEKIKRVLKVGVITGVIAGVVVTGVISIITSTVKNNKHDKEVAKLETEITKLKTEMEEMETVKTDFSDPAEQLASDSEDWYLTLVNAQHPLKEEYVPELAELEDGMEVDERILEATTKMLEDAEEEGLDMIVRSAYRSYDTQKTYFCSDMKSWVDSEYSVAEAFEKTSESVALPGNSEHATGLALDIVAKSYQELDEGQEDTDEAQWLMENCWKYGFILRYPNDKTEITGIIYEPWHYRYVGEEAAKEITEQGITLEEYLGVVEE